MRWPRLEERRWLALAVLGLVLVRVVLFPASRNYLGDAVMRAELAARWALAPHLIPHAGEVLEIGPLHIYLIGGMLRLLPGAAEVASRLPSLLFGVLLWVPLSRLARRTGAPLGPFLAVAGVAVYGLQIQASTAAASEAIFLTLLLTALDGALSVAEGGGVGYGLLGGLALLLTTAMRYDGWIYAGLISLGLSLALLRGRARLPSVLAYLTLGWAFPLSWCLQNARHLGDPLWTFHRHGTYHRDFVRRLIAERGLGLYRLHAALYWPINLFLTLTPGLFGLGLLGAARALRERRLLLLLACCGVPPLLLTYQATVPLAFGLVPRFTIVAGGILLVFAGLGWQVVQRWARPVHGLLVAVLAVAFPVGLGLLTHDRGDRLAERLRPVSPLSELPPAVSAAATWLRAHGDGAGAAAILPVVIDHNDGFAGMTVAYYSGLPAASVVRVSWQGWEAALAQQSPRCAVLFDNGWLGARLGSGEAPSVVLQGQTMRRVLRAGPPGGVQVSIYCLPESSLASAALSRST